ncbi:hypothetical protein [Nocardia carnea]|uniref:hypothetical protein n=1 Tax=Nocardia carnea TaxID=37328 RepID=UPI00245446A6|nr:hypothetical protein [Nocardia carnea]
MDTEDVAPTAEAGSADPAPAAGEAVEVSEKQSSRSTASTSKAVNGGSATELVHVPSVDIEEMVDENRRLREALREADREIRAMRDLLVVYASR